MPNLFLIIIVFIAGLAIEALGTAISVIGVSAMFGGNLIIIAFILAIDIGKIVTISAAYNYWEHMSKVMRTCAIVVIAVTMTISSSGAAGYFSGEFEKAMIGNKSAAIEIAALESQIVKYEERKKQIDNQIANLPSAYASARVRMMNAFKQEQESITAQISAIEAKLPALKTHQLNTAAKAGPILAIATALDIPLEWAINFVIGLLIIVFNPFAVFLVTLGNFLAKRRGEMKVANITAAMSTTPAVSPVMDTIVPVVTAVSAVTAITESAIPETQDAEKVVESLAEDTVSTELTHVEEVPVVEETIKPESDVPVNAEESITEEHAVEETAIEPAIEEPVIERLRERTITRVASLPVYTSKLLDPSLDAIVDNTELDAYSQSQHARY